VSKKSKKSLYSNIDNNVTDADRAIADRNDELEEAIDRKVKGSDGYETQGQLNPRHATVTETQLSWDAKDIRERRNSGKPVIPVWSFEDDYGETHWILTDEDAEACRLGYICENCLGWQKSNLTIDCETINHSFSCGHRRGL